MPAIWSCAISALAISACFLIVNRFENRMMPAASAPQRPALEAKPKSKKRDAARTEADVVNAAAPKVA